MVLNGELPAKFNVKLLLHIDTNPHRIIYLTASFKVKSPQRKGVDIEAE
jgi:hypothetical protein